MPRQLQRFVKGYCSCCFHLACKGHKFQEEDRQKNSFTSADENEITIDNELLTRYNHPTKLKKYPGIVEVTMTPLFNIGEPIVQPLVDDLSPLFIHLNNECEDKKAAEKRRKKLQDVQL